MSTKHIVSLITMIAIILALILVGVYLSRKESEAEFDSNAAEIAALKERVAEYEYRATRVDRPQAKYYHCYDFDELTPTDIKAWLRGYYHLWVTPGGFFIPVPLYENLGHLSVIKSDGTIKHWQYYERPAEYESAAMERINNFKTWDDIPQFRGMGKPGHFLTFPDEITEPPSDTDITIVEVLAVEPGGGIPENELVEIDRGNDEIIRTDR